MMDELSDLQKTIRNKYVGWGHFVYNSSKCLTLHYPKICLNDDYMPAFYIYDHDEFVKDPEEQSIVFFVPEPKEGFGEYIKNSDFDNYFKKAQKEFKKYKNLRNFK